MSNSDTQQIKNTPLSMRHMELGARLVPFAGWRMPMQYSGILQEHWHTREQAGLFDICHMGELYVSGPTALDDLERLITCRLSDLEVGRCRYGFLTRENGTIIDDLITFRTKVDEFLLVVNAATTDKDAHWIHKHLSETTKFQDESNNIAKIDLQGPKSAEVMKAILDSQTIEKIRRFSFIEILIDDMTVLLSRTGYTGEDGFELFVNVQKAEVLWDRLLQFDQVEPIGLGARDSLRMEMGYPLYGHDIDDQHTPIEANLSRFVCFDKEFIGKKALMEQFEEGTEQLLMAFVCEGRRAARQHFHLLVDGHEVGHVTSGGFSPCLTRGIGMAYIDQRFALSGQNIVLKQGALEIQATIQDVPVYCKS